MGFAYNPDGGLARIIRYVDQPDDTVALLNKEQNLLVINKRLFDRLDELEQLIVKKTQELYLDALPCIDGGITILKSKALRNVNCAA